MRCVGGPDTMIVERERRNTADRDVTVQYPRERSQGADMAKTPEQMMEIMVASVREHCPEPIDVAMICSHAGSMAMAAISAITRSGPGLARTSELPNPVLIAAGEEHVYAFKFVPKGFKLKVKKGWEVARWRREDVGVAVGEDKRIQAITLRTPDGDYHFEVTTLKRDATSTVLDRFVDRIGRIDA